ncbi:alpha 1,3-glucosidase [Cladophialophora psammophila CBS 110553]|uniref:alpha-glucosidase n=1 Tax=Cladophialophora psammophila CBS 110553 TaxID=1182543 RepID=W9WPF8_9EURO|nr:alpha 1,3-glucosidase [Cladophialophora psammophila CBS 110553]EXJ69793.1 alpha 1,3-glucosidase [Cladophialophora psammophila CBS 110553]
MTEKGGPESSPYQLDAASIKFKHGRLDGSVIKSLVGGDTVKLPLTMTFLDRGNVRVTIDEEKRRKGEIELRQGSVARKERYNEVGTWALTGAGLHPQTTAEMKKVSKDVTEVSWGPGGHFKASIRHAPFGIEFWSGEEKHVVLNGRGFLNVEHWRPKIEQPVVDDNSTEPPPTEPTEDESTWWDESFGGNTDSKPKGPESVAMDITFPGYAHVYGLPEHAGPLSLKETRGGDEHYDQPYRMYNSDVFEYELDSPMTLYGSIPFMHAHKKGSTVGVFWLNAAETWVDIVKSKHDTNPLTLGLTGGVVDTQTHWISESGLLDVFVMLGPTPQEVSKSYGELTGYTTMPASFAIAYHQCRWNYVSDEDVKDVDRKFDKFNIPYDVIWLDIEYTDDKKYFTWDPLNFPDPISMEKQLDETQRKLVVIIDPHIKNKEGYFVADELKSKDLAVKNKENNIFEGWCWPGSSYWIDAFNPAARAWWKSLFTFDRFKGTQSNVWLWNDMNEPSVFNGPEITMPRDNLHHGNWEHRDLHNINGMTFHNATYHALLERKKGETRRPFVLTRSFYSGSQRSAAMWTGDNQASWEHLAASIPMILNQGVGGFPFAGADVGGFFGNPSKELQTRWYQAGAFYPFMRGHAHIDTRRREPYMLGEPYTSIMTQALRLRYSLLPAWYTAFHEAATDGYPIVRAQYFVHPTDDKGFDIDDQMYLGSTGLLVKPVTIEGGESVDIYLADDENYYDYFDYTIYAGGSRTHKVDAPLDKIPLLMQGGHIFPRKERPRKSSGLMKWDPYTLVVVLDKQGEKAEGTLYVDDGETFDYQQGAYIHRNFSVAGGVLRSSDIGTKGAKTAGYLKTMKEVKIEKIVVVNAPAAWSSAGEIRVTEDGIKEDRKVEMIYHSAAGNKTAWAVVRNPGMGIGVDWSMKFPESADSGPKTEL